MTNVVIGTNARKIIDKNNQSSNWNGITQGSLINKIIEIGQHSTDKLMKYNDDENNTDYYVSLGDLNFVCSNINNLPVTLNDKKLLVQLMSMFTEKNTYGVRDANLINKNRFFEYPVESFGELIGYKDTPNNRKEMAKMLKTCIQHLDSYRIEASSKAIEKTKDKEITIKEYGKIPLLGYVGMKTVKIKQKNPDSTETEIERQTIKIERGFIKLALSMELASYLTIAPFTYVPKELKITKNPLTFFLAYDFATHYSINKLHNFKNANYRKISSLLEKNKELPTYDDVKINGGRKYFEKIIKPFCQGLSNLTSFHIELCSKDENDNFIPRSDVNFDNGEFMNLKGILFEEFQKLYIVFEPLDYPKEEIQNNK